MTINTIINVYGVAITVHDNLNCKVVITDYANNRMVGYKGTASGCTDFISRKTGKYVSIY